MSQFEFLSSLNILKPSHAKKNATCKHHQGGGTDSPRSDDDLDEDENHEAAEQYRAARANGPKYEGSFLRN